MTRDERIALAHSLVLESFHKYDLRVMTREILQEFVRQCGVLDKLLAHQVNPTSMRYTYVREGDSIAFRDDKEVINV